MANRFGITGADAVLDLFGNAANSTLTVHATEADATGNVNVLGAAIIVKGKWQYSDATRETVWVRLADGTVWPVQSPDSSLKLAQAANLADVSTAATARTNLGLGNVDNTSDANKPLSTAATTALGLKQNTSTLDAAIQTQISNPVSATRVKLDQTYTSIAVEASLAIAGKPSGAITTFDTGHAVTSFGNSLITCDGSGSLVHTNLGSGNSAGYYEIQTTAGNNVQYVRAQVSWDVGANGQIAIVLPSSQWSSGVLPNAGIHFVMAGNGQWHISRWVSGVGETYYDSDATSGRFADCRDGVTRDLIFYVNQTAGTVRIIFPDGSSKVCSSPYITTETNKWVVYELYEAGPGLPPGKFHDLAMGTYVASVDTPFLPRANAKDVVNAARRTVVEFTTSASGAIPVDTVGVLVTLIAPGGGGGSGRRGAAGTVRCGGGGGGSGGIIREQWFPMSALGGTYTVVVGAGGAGGAAVTTDNTDGNAGGGSALACTFASGNAYLKAFNAGGGGGGTISAAAGGGAGAPALLATGGMASLANGAAGGTATNNLTGGCGYAAAGGGITSADVANNGGAGSSAATFSSVLTGGTAGVVGGAAPTGGAALLSNRPGDGPGGGAASITAAAQAGADAIGYGAGGGGGGASLNGFNSGRGGNGGSGFVQLTFVRL